jgi:hypothetical protein
MYAILNGEATRPWTEAIAMKRPAPEVFRSGHEYRASRNGLVRRSATIVFHFSTGNSSIGET